MKTTESMTVNTLMYRSYEFNRGIGCRAVPLASALQLDAEKALNWERAYLRGLPGVPCPDCDGGVMTPYTDRVGCAWPLMESSCRCGYTQRVDPRR